MLKLIKQHIILILIFTFAFVVREVGTKPGYPPRHDDEPTVFSTTIHMIIHRLKPNQFYYPAGVPLLNSLIYRYTLLPVSLFKMFFLHPKVFLAAVKIGPRFIEEFQVAIFGNRSIEALFLSRYISAFIGGLTIPLLYYLTKKLFNKTTALFASLFLAFSYRHVLGSHFGLPDVYNGFFNLLAFGASILLLKKNTKKRYLWGGVTVALSLSIKYQIFSLLPFLLVHLIWSIRKKNWRYLFHGNFIQALILIPIVFLVLNPYLMFNLKKWIPELQTTSRRYAMGTNRFHFYPYFYLYHWGIGRFPCLAIILGSILMLILKPQTFFLIFSSIFPFFYVMTYYSSGGGYVRNFVSVIPFLFIFAGFFFQVLSQIFQKLKFIPTNFIIAILVLYFNFTPIKDSITASIHYLQPWNLTKINNWYVKKMPNKVKLRAYNVLPDDQAQKAIKEKGVKFLSAFYEQGPNSLAEFKEEGTDFALINSLRLHQFTYGWIDWPYKYLKKYDNVPFEFIQSSFVGLTVKELLGYTVYEAYKPWQADEENYLVFKIPSHPKELGKKITAFNFDKKNQTWPMRIGFDFEPFEFGWSEEEGKKDFGALAIYPGDGADTSRLSSPPIPVTPGKYYTVKGWIKNKREKENNKDRENQDSFLRIDFYQNKSEKVLERLGIKVALSPRVPINNQWAQIQASAIAPPEAYYLTVSFQIKQYSRSYSAFLDNVEIFETEIIPEEKFPEVPYIKSTISPENLYRNSIL